jgi:hypothetical protein
MGQVDATFTHFAFSDLAPMQRIDVVPVIMICLFLAMVAFALLAHRLIRHELGKRRPLAPPPPWKRVSAALFEPPMRWLAVRSENPRLVQSALGLQNPRACAWTDALIAPFEPRLFISPAVKGWVIVMGCDLPDPADDVDECFLFLTQLSQKLGEVQFFVRHRAVSHHGWARLVDGKVSRAYFWAGETLWNQGAPTESERELKLRCLGYAEDTDDLGLSHHEVLSLNTDKVIRLAGAWSVDPIGVEPDALDAKGIAGDLLHSKLH